MTLRGRLELLFYFAQSVGYVLRELDNGGFAFKSGDPDFICTVENGRYVLRRDERGTISPPLIVAENVAHIELYLTYLFGPESSSQLETVAHGLDAEPAVLGEVRDGVAFWGSYADVHVSWFDAEGRKQVVSGMGRFDAAEFAVYARWSAVDIRASFEDRSGVGAPMFVAEKSFVLPRQPGSLRPEPK